MTRVRMHRHRAVRIEQFSLASLGGRYRPPNMKSGTGIGQRWNKRQRLKDTEMCCCKVSIIHRRIDHPTFPSPP